MRDTPINILVSNMQTKQDIQKVSAILLYRVNVSIKYVQHENPGLAKSFYRLKSKYIFYLIDEGFAIERKDASENMIIHFEVFGINLKFHQIKNNKLSFTNTIDTSNPTSEILKYSKDIPVMIKMLVKIGEVLKIDRLS